ncbi:MAG: hypothetical protein K2N87_19380 [Eubacterium sp.]|nr:hypothetical protein [Eubacterium sp.]
MSNLYKAHVNINKGEAYTRVIDYNELLEQKLTALSFERQAQLQREKMAERKQSGEEAQEGEAEGGQAEFSEGLLGVSVDVSPELEIDYVERAKEQADEIMAKATADAEAVLKKAVQEAEKLKETARKQAQEQGYAEGMERAKAQEGQMRAELEQLREQQEKDYADRLHTMEPELMDAVIQVFDQVFHTELADHRAVLLHLIRRTVQNIKNSREFRIFVSADDYAEVSGRKQEIIEKIGGEVTLDIIMDESMQSGQCTIDTDEGIFECGMDIQLANLTKDLRALSCSTYN